MKKLIVTLMVLTALVSCGKTNAVGNSSVFGTSPITVGGSTETQLGSMIDNNQFGTGSYYYDTFAGAIAKGASQYTILEAMTTRQTVNQMGWIPSYLYQYRL